MSITAQPETTHAPVTFDTRPEAYRHWTLAVEGQVARLTLDVDEDAGLVSGYDLKLNSYDLGVDIELYDAVQRLRFEHPRVRAVVVGSGKPKVFCAGANIRMLAGSSHAWKVNFCKFTNETRNGMEDASAHSGLTFIAAIDGTAAGGGYELALACDEIVLLDDGSSAVSLPEVALLGVLPGTGGLTRVVDKRGVRKDLADVFATRPDGVRGRTAVDWGLVDEAVPRSRACTTCANPSRPMSKRAATCGRWSTFRTFTSVGTGAWRSNRCCCARPAARTRRASWARSTSRPSTGSRSSSDISEDSPDFGSGRNRTPAELGGGGDWPSGGSSCPDPQVWSLLVVALFCDA